MAIIVAVLLAVFEVMVIIIMVVERHGNKQIVGIATPIIVAVVVGCGIAVTMMVAIIVSSSDKGAVVRSQSLVVLMSTA